MTHQPILEDVHLAGEHVRLRPHAESDARAAFGLLHAREPVLRWLVWDGPRDVGELASYYASWRVGSDDGDDYHLAVERIADGALVGSLGLRFLGHPGNGDLGYWIGERYQRQGYASEAVALAVHLAFTHLAADSLSAWVFVGNEASRRVLEKAGFRYVRTATRDLPGRGLQEEWSLALLRSEWERREARLRPLEERIRTESTSLPGGGEERSAEPQP